jgi:hypothetical protein
MQSPAPVSKTTRGTFFAQPVRLVTTIVAGVTGLIVLIDSAGAGGVITPLAFLLVNWAAILISLALLVGLLSVAGSHVRRVFQRDNEWGYSVVLLLAMLTVIVVGIFRVPESGSSPLQPNLAEEPVRRFFHAVYEPLTSSLLALLAFFSLSTIIRTLQQPRTEALVIIGVALAVLILQLPLISTLPLVGETLGWFNQYVAMAGARGLLIGVAIGTIVASMRVLLGFDQPYLE